MGSKNSIIRNMTRDATISEIILEKSADIKKEKAFIVLEGYDDIRCLKKIVTQNVVMILSFSGKDGVKEIVQHFGSDRVIGICDRDYEAVANTQEIFYYDFCCLEMMLISADAAFEAICSEYYNNEEDVLSMREAILRKLFILSNIRKANAEQKLGINFKGVSVSDVANMDDTTAYSELIRRIKRVNPQKACEIEICTNSMQETDSTLASYNDLLKITQGHDFINAFQSYCSKAMFEGVRIASAHEIAGSLRCAYTIDMFRNTDLYKDLCNHATKAHVRLVS